jgi:hypothetical protein
VGHNSWRAKAERIESIQRSDADRELAVEISSRSAKKRRTI